MNFRAGLPPDAVQLVPTTDRQAVSHLLFDERVHRSCDSSAAEVTHRTRRAEAKMPVIKHFDGVCHVYVDAAADLPMAERIVLNAKCRCPGHLQRGGILAGSSGHR